MESVVLLIGKVLKNDVYKDKKKNLGGILYEKNNCNINFIYINYYERV